MTQFRKDLKASSGKGYRFETTAIGSGPVGAIELSIWAPKRLTKDKLIFVDYPLLTVQASPTGPTEDEMKEIKETADALIAKVETAPEETWAMDRPALLRASDRVVIDLMADYDALNEPVFVWDHDAAWYIGQGEKMAVHRAGLI
jgi:hypothetical protein